jgi:hypothetical protein
MIKIHKVVLDKIHQVVVIRLQLDNVLEEDQRQLVSIELYQTPGFVV